MSCVLCVAQLVLLLAVLFLEPASPFGVEIVDPEFARCLWNYSFFDMVLETDNYYTPFWQSHIPRAAKVPTAKAAVDALGDCLDDDARRVLVVSPEGVDSVYLANKLADEGMSHVYMLRGGLDEWKTIGGETAGGACCAAPGLSCEARSVSTDPAEERWLSCRKSSGGSGPGSGSAGYSPSMPSDGVVLDMEWARALGSGGSWSTGIDIAEHGRSVVIAGDMESECSFGPGRAVASRGGGLDAFVMLVDNHLGDVLWAISIGSSRRDSATDIRMSSDGGVYVMGDAGGGKLYVGNHEGVPMQGDAFESDSDGGVYLARLSPDEGRLEWIQALGSKGPDKSGRLVLGRGCGQHPGRRDEGCDDNVYAGGEYMGTLETGGVRVAAEGGSDLFIAQVDRSGRRIVQARLGGQKRERFGGIVLDSRGGSLVVAFTSPGANLGMSGLGSSGSGVSGSWKAAEDTCSAAKENGACLWVVSVGARNMSLSWAKAFGIQCGLNQRHCGINVSSVHSDMGGNVIVSGQFAGQAMGWSEMRSSGLSDGFVFKISEANGEMVWSNRIGGQGRNQVSSVVVGPQSRLFATGVLNGNASMGRMPHATLASMTSWNGRFGGEVTVATKDMFLAMIEPRSGEIEWLVTSLDAVGKSIVQGVGLAAHKNGVTLVGNMDALSVHMLGLKLGDVGADQGHLAGMDTRQIFVVSFEVPGLQPGGAEALHSVVEKVALVAFVLLVTMFGLLLFARWGLELLLAKMPLSGKGMRSKKKGRYGRVGKRGIGDDSEGIEMLEAVIEEDEDASWSASRASEDEAPDCTSPVLLCVSPSAYGEEMPGNMDLVCDETALRDLDVQHPQSEAEADGESADDKI